MNIIIYMNKLNVLRGKILKNGMLEKKFWFHLDMDLDLVIWPKFWLFLSTNYEF